MFAQVGRPCHGAAARGRGQQEVDKKEEDYQANAKRIYNQCLGQKVTIERLAHTIQRLEKEKTVTMRLGSGIVGTSDWDQQKGSYSADLFGSPKPIRREHWDGKEEPIAPPAPLLIQTIKYSGTPELLVVDLDKRPK